MHQKILFVGATSAISQECAREYARRGATMCLAGRSLSRLETVRQDLLSIGAQQVECCLFEAETEIALDFIERAATSIGGLDAILVAHGSLPDQTECNADVELSLHEFHINATSVIAVCLMAAHYFEQNPRRSGSSCIAVISSVAGERGRQSNYIYGASKGAVSIFLQGLRNRLHPKGIHVLCVKPGFVDTPMTAHLPKNALFASARRVGKRIYKAMEAGSDVVYVPGYWRYVMGIIRLIPESVFKTLKL